jgi:hypothetical protein
MASGSSVSRVARFQTGWIRFLPFLGYHHVLMILIAIAIILLCKFQLIPMQVDIILTFPQPCY